MLLGLKPGIESSFCCCSVAKLCLPLCNPQTAAHQASLSLTISRRLPKFMSIESVMLSNHLILCRPLLLLSIFPSIRVFSNEVDIIDARMFIASINSKCPPDITILILPKMKVKLLSRPTLCDPVDCSLPGSSVHGILQARILEWVAISISRRSSLIQGLNPGLPHCRQTL